MKASAQPAQMPRGVMMGTSKATKGMRSAVATRPTKSGYGHKIISSSALSRMSFLGSSSGTRRMGMRGLTYTVSHLATQTYSAGSVEVCARSSPPLAATSASAHDRVEKVAARTIVSIAAHHAHVHPTSALVLGMLDNVALATKFFCC
jgi:hypothetical protein